MQTSILNEFLVLEEQLSFSKAARELGISQATLSKHILSLENEFGAPLFERTTQKVSLTPYGEVFVEHARSIISCESSFRKKVEQIRFQTSSHLVIGTIGNPYFYGITALFASFKKIHPDASIEVHVGSTDELLKMLESGKIDVAFLRNLTDLNCKYQSFFYHNDFLSLIVPANHPKAGKSVVHLSEFSTETFYSRVSKDSLMGQLEAKALREAGFEPIFSSSRGTLEDSVINQGNNLSLANQALANTLAGNIHLSVLTIEPPIHTDIWLAAAREQHSDIVQDFFRFVQEHADIDA